MTKLIQIEDKELREAILKLRKKIETEPDKKKYTKEDFVLMEEAFKAITGKYPPSGCGGCAILFQILNNWFTYNYDRIPKHLAKKPLKKLENVKTVKAKDEVKNIAVATSNGAKKFKADFDIVAVGTDQSREVLKKLHRSVLMKMCKDATPRIEIKNTDKSNELIEKLLNN